MTSWRPNLEGRKGPRYIAIADALARDVAEGALPAGTRLPTHRELAWDLGVTVGTVSRAYAEAERRGLISGEVGRGTYVRGSADADHQAFLAHMRPAPDAAVTMNFAFPPPLTDAAPFAAALHEMADDPALAELLSYQVKPGSPRHREAGAAWLKASGVEVAPDQVTITAGAQHAIMVALATLLRPGDRIACECLTYPGLLALTRLFALRPEGLAMDEEGLCPEALASACRTNDLRVLYLIPNFQNPTQIMMPERRRREILAVAEEHDLMIVEDDIFGPLGEDLPPTLQSLAPERVVYISGLSKTVSPGLRIGYLAGPEALNDRLVGAVRATCWMAPPLTADLASRIILNGEAEKLRQAARQEALARREIALEILGPWSPACPPGAISLWLPLPEPWRSADFTVQAAEAGVNVRPAEICAVGRQTQVHAVKVSLGPPRDRETLRLGLNRLVDLLMQESATAFGAVL